LYGAVEESDALLTWEPRYAEMASSVDLGYTTGPWEYFPDKDTETPTAFGDYFSIWQHSASGGWELMLDLGISREQAEPASGLETYVATIGRDVRSFSVRDVREIDSVFADQVRRAGFGFYDSVATRDVRLLRDNTLRIVGKDTLQKVNLPTYRSTATGAAVSEPGDLGYVYGVAAGNVRGADGRFVPGEGGFVRIWRRVGNEMKLAAEVMSMRPKE